MKNRYLLIPLLLCLGACGKEQPVEEYGALRCVQESIEPATKTDITSSYIVKWTGGEMVRVSNGSASADFEADASSTGTTILRESSGSITPSSDYYAVYPGTVSGASASEGTYCTTIPATQAHVAGRNIPDGAMPMVGTGGGDGVIQFKNAAGILHFRPRLYDKNEPNFTETGETVEGITITANENLAGDVTIDYTQGGTPVTTITANGSKTVTVTCTGIAFGSDFYVVLPAGTYTGVKITVSYLDSNGDPAYCAVPLGGNDSASAISGSITIKRNTITSCGAVSFFGTGLSDCIDLGASETANCYMVTTASQWYMFSIATPGNGVATTGSKSSYHNIPSTIDVSQAKYVYVYYTMGAPMFEVEPHLNAAGDAIIFKTSSSESFGKGSALISVCSDEWDGDLTKTQNALWSWHIWAVPGGVGTQIKGDYTWMDRNLGASSGEYCGDVNDEFGNGFFYQWGRKDPFMAKITSTVPTDNIFYPSDSKCGPASFGYQGFSSYYTKAWGTTLKTVQDPHKLYGGAYSTSSLDYNFDWMAETLVNNSVTTGISYFDWWSSDENASASAASLYGRTKEKDTGDHHKTMFDPCPPGWRVPTVRACYKLYQGKTTAAVGKTTVIDGDVNVPTSGVRRPGVENNGIYGYIWSANGVQSSVNIGGTSISVDNFAHCMVVNLTATNKAAMQTQRRGYAFPVRCIKDE